MNLLASLSCQNETHLVVGGNSNIAALRVNSILASGASPILIQNKPIETLPISLQDLISANKIKLIQSEFKFDFLTSLGRAAVDHVVDRVFVTLDLDEGEKKREISEQCCRLRIPVNVSDSPELCTFTLLSTYTNGGFQMGVTTSGKGCKLASRIKRELVSKLPINMGEICDRVGELRQKLQDSDASEIGGNDEDAVTTSKLNALVKEFNMTLEQKAAQRARFLSQIVEYYPLEKLAHITMDTLTTEYASPNTDCGISENDIIRQKKKGSISLVGSGPGSVSMLTLGALQEIHSADLILADKLVPQQVLDLIPQKRTNLFIARKFPGNAERAQQELLTMGLEGLQRGEKVVRLKQGDPYIFGRGGEEYLFFSSHGFVPNVLPGITSALAAPVYSNIPATHRDVADQVLICTGTGRRGALPNLPEFVESRTTVFLMALHRIVDLIPHLITQKKWAADLPVAIVERASCPDQRIIRTTLAKAPAAVEALGSRPPGLFIAGYACGVLATLLEKDWIVEEGHSLNEISGVLEKLASSV
ncbi:S-adenosyl-L-methionine uroporphyrinogen III transmethylase [Metschnikowia bicuspidata var. bicuspidata NRRL YB-4993]|uniref:S-adenosyl-L-methionine uroporphyrinogen III transmethylase n=1 Tax=Metschnikowia bicuspidata var. bicuspidata NRRL YB-4993 TaxID=869754 RepID=A0A1A0HDM1_9ASCO|nr:S-adenosyl-L-methionine uroporphyrinogen III transmethylase [Metschnikowia bicuspidata var. bicuspidata NRRL YB-4993]OBA22179.1 S-adenosyl-L-methionine uroporphyrinogen III transmethylase [Metschnikowia bicuspidata var. bicuspidata NRRL YB-4993]